MNGLISLVTPLNKIPLFSEMCQDARNGINRLTTRFYQSISNPSQPTTNLKENKQLSVIKTLAIKVGKEAVGIAAVAGLTHVLFYQFCRKENLCFSDEKEGYWGSVESPVIEELLIRGFVQHSVLIGQLALNHVYNSIFTKRRPLHHNSTTQKVIRISTSTLATSVLHATLLTDPFSLLFGQSAYGKLTDETGSLIPTLFLHCMHNLFYHTNRLELMNFSPPSIFTRVFTMAEVFCLTGILFYGKKIFSIQEMRKLVSEQPEQAPVKQASLQLKETKVD